MRKIATLLETLEAEKDPEAKQQKIRDFQKAIAQRNTQYKKEKENLTKLREQRFDNEEELDTDSIYSLDKAISKSEKTLQSLKNYINDMKDEIQEAVSFYAEKNKPAEEKEEDNKSEEDFDIDNNKTVLVDLAKQCAVFIQKVVDPTISDDRDVKNAYIKLNKQIQSVSKKLQKLTFKGKYSKQAAVTTALLAPSFIYNTAISALSDGLSSKPGVLNSALGEIVQKIKGFSGEGYAEDLNISKKRQEYLKNLQTNIVQNSKNQHQNVVKVLGQIFLGFPNDATLLQQFKSIANIDFNPWMSVVRSLQKKNPLAAAGLYAYLTLLQGVNTAIMEI